MLDTKSMEALASKQISSNQAENIILDYESYFKNSMEYCMSIENLYKNIKITEDKFIATIKLAKDEYKMSQEDTKITVKKSFGLKIKEFFTKIWTFIVSIFEKILLMVVNLVKSLIVFIQKKRLAGQVIIKKCDEVIRDISNNSANSALDSIIQDMYKYRLKSVGKEPTDTKHWEWYHNRINGKAIEEFMAAQKVYLNNRKSVFNLDFLEEILRDNINEHISLSPSTNLTAGSATSDQKLDWLFTQIQALTNQAIMGAEVPDASGGLSRSGYLDSWIERILYGSLEDGVKDPAIMINLADISSLKSFCNAITYGKISPTVPFADIRVLDFLGITEEKVNTSRPYVVQTLLTAINDYKNDYVKVCGPNGYIESLEKVIKGFKDLAKKDSDKIKTIRKYVFDQLDLIQKGANNYDPNDVKDNEVTVRNNVLHGRLKQFTNIINRVNNVKAKFVTLRQYMIGNLITMISTEEYVIRVLCKCIDKNKLDDADFSSNEFTKVDTGINDTANASGKDISQYIEEGDESLNLETFSNIMDKIDAKLDEVTDSLASKVSAKLDNLTEKANAVADKLPFGKGDKDEDDEYEDSSWDDESSSDDEDDYSFDSDDF